jgi:hypothetical protein
LIVVLSELRTSLRTAAARLSAVPAAAVVMAAIAFVGRLALIRLGVDVEERAVLTILLALFAYAIALWLLAPDIVRRAITIGRSLIARAPGPRRRVQLAGE